MTKGGYDVVKYLISMGIAKLGNRLRLPTIAYAETNPGISESLFERVFYLIPDLIRFGDWMRPSGGNGGSVQRRHHRSCLNDMAGGAYDYLHDHGIKVGQDSSLAGYDNKDISEYLRPRLTTNEIQLKMIERHRKH